METKISNIKNKLTAFNDKVYTKKEVLRELLKLQSQMVRALPENSLLNPKSKVSEIIEYLNQENNRLGKAADKELEDFSNLSAEFNNRIAAEISGVRGEKQTFKALQTIKKPCRLLKNVELKFENHTTEIDLVAITDSAIFLIEVKNSKCDIIIDEKGNYRRINHAGQRILDKNIGVQMNEKEYILRKVLKSASIENVNIQSLVVFTNSKINVTNNYPYIKECFLSDLSHIIEEYAGLNKYQPKILYAVANAIINASSENSWPIKMDIEAYKDSFATLLAKLQTAEERKAARAARFDTRIIDFFGSLFRRVAKVACCIFR